MSEQTQTELIKFARQLTGLVVVCGTVVASVWIYSNRAPQQAAPAAPEAPPVVVVEVDQPAQLRYVLQFFARELPKDKTVTDSNRLFDAWDKASELAFSGVETDDATDLAIDAVWPDVAASLQLRDKVVSLDKSDRIQASTIFAKHAAALK